MGPRDTTSDNVSSGFTQAREASDLARLREEARANIAATGSAPAPEEEAPEESFLQSAGRTGLSVGKDLMGGLVEGPRQVIGGARDAVQNTLQALDSMAMWLDENVGTPELLKGDVGRIDMPQVDEPSTVTGGAIRSVSQFVTGFIPALRLTRMAAGGAALSAAGKLAQVEAAAAVASALVFDPHEQRLSDLIEEVPQLSNPVTRYLQSDPNDSEAEGRFKNAVEGLGFGLMAEGFVRGVRAIRSNRVEKGVDPKVPLAAPEERIVSQLGDPDAPGIAVRQTPEAENFNAWFAGSKVSGADGAPVRVFHGTKKDFDTFDTLGGVSPGAWFSADKQAAEAFGPAREVYLSIKKPGTLKDLAEARKTAAVKFDPQTQGREFNQEVVRVLEDAGFDGIHSKASKGAGGEEVWVALRPEQIRPAGLSTVPVRGIKEIPKEELDAAVDSFLTGKVGSDALPFQMNWASYTKDGGAESVYRDVAQLFKGRIDEARRGTITDEELGKLADKLGMTPEDLLARNQGSVFNAEQVLAARTILDAASGELIRLSRTARQSTNEADLYAVRQMLNIHAGLQQQFQGAASEAGRAFRAFQLPSGSKEKQIEAIRASMMQDGGPDAVRRLANALAEVDDPVAINKVVRGSFGKRATDAVVEAWYFALLSGPQTHAVNVATSSMNTLWQIPTRYLAAQVGKLRNSPDAVAEGEATAMAYGLAKSAATAIRAAGKTFITEEPSDIFGKIESRTPKAITAENFGFGGAKEGSIGWAAGKAVDGFGAFIRLPTRAIMAEDEFFRVVGRSMELNRAAFRQATLEGLEGEALAARVNDLVQNPTAQMMDDALDFSRSLTFTEPLGQQGQNFQNLVNNFPVLKAILPFIRTPVNLLKHAGRQTPLAPLMQSVRADLAAGGPRADLAITRMAMGTTMMLAMADQVWQGNVTGHGPTDPDLRSVWLRTNQPYSVKVGDTWYSYNRSDPFGMFLGAAASYAELAGQADYMDSEELVGAVAVATSQSVMSKTWMRGPAEFLEAMTHPDRYGDKWVRQQIGTFLMPTGAAQTARVMDPVWRDVNSIADAIRARTPGFSDTLPPRRNIWGEPIHMEGGLGPDIISPVYKYGVKDSPIDTWMLDNRVPIRMPARTQFEGIELSPQEYSRFVELAGNGVKDPSTGLGAKETFDAILAGEHPLSGVWASGTDGPEGTRSIIARNIVQSFREAARGAILQEFPELMERRMLRLQELERARQETIMDPRAGVSPQ